MLYSKNFSVKRGDGIYKMLIIAIPKSASSSLQSTLIRIHGLDAKMVFRVDNEYNSNKKILKKMINDKNTICKEAIYPTKENIEFLKGKKKVVLLREPKECVEAFERGMRNYIHATDNYFLAEFNFEEFYNLWKNNIDDNTLLIFYKDLMENPTETINKVERFFDLPESHKVKLDKVYYSRSKIHKFGRYIYVKLKSIRLLRYVRRNYLDDLQLMVVDMK